MRIGKTLKYITVIVSIVLLSLALNNINNAKMFYDSSALSRTTTELKTAPKTAEGFQKLWKEQVSPEEWGAADMAISTKITDGRTVWLYGDTMSFKNGFVNSSAITQRGGNLHVSNSGKQVFPKGKDKNIHGYKTVYWIEAARPNDNNTIIATVAETRIGEASVWDFKREKETSQEALLAIDDEGNVNFQKWLEEVPAPALDTKLITFDKNNRHHFAYAKQVHTQFVLSSGKPLLSYSQNWDDVEVGEFKRTPAGEIDWDAYRPIFTEDEIEDAFS